MKYTVMPSSTSPCSTTTRRRRFNANDPKYRCCCGGQCHIRTGAMFVGAAEIIIVCLIMIAAGVWFVYDGFTRAHDRRYGLNRAQYVKDYNDGLNENEEQQQPWFILDRWPIVWLSTCLVLGLVFILTVALLFAGIIRERRYLLWPHMVAQWILLIIFTALTIYFIVMAILAAEALVSLTEEEAADDDNRKHQTIRRLVKYSSQTAACLVALIVFGIFFRIVQRCYRYLRDSELHEKKLRYSVGSSPNSTINGRQTLIIESGTLLRA